ncbi:MAG: flagellar FlbD family protein, partial [Oscillospiraceae bacterium]
IKLTKISGDEFVINDENIQIIEVIPESKIVMHDGSFYIVRESVDEIIRKAIEYKARILAFEKDVISKDNREF